jgi:hypothetical protein
LPNEQILKRIDKNLALNIAGVILDDERLVIIILVVMVVIGH